MGSTIQSSYRERGVVRKHHNSPCADFLNILDLVLHDLIVLRSRTFRSLPSNCAENECALRGGSCLPARLVMPVRLPTKSVIDIIVGSMQVAYRLRFVPSVL